MSNNIVAIVGSYRKNGTIDQIVMEILSSAEDRGAKTKTIHLLDKHIEFCKNCRACTQVEGGQRGKCVQEDDMEAVLGEIERADGFVLGAPVNFFNVNALTRRFMERLVCYAYWPWGGSSPRLRSKAKTRKAILVTSTGMPGFLARFFTGAPKALKVTAQTLGVRPVGSLFAGLSAQKEKTILSKKTLKKARILGKKIGSPS